MSLCTSTIFPQPSTSLLRTVKSIPNTTTSLNSSLLQIPYRNPNSKFPSNPKPFLPISRTQNFLLQSHCFASEKTESNPAPDESPTLNSPDEDGGGSKKPKTRRSSARAGKKPAAPKNKAGGDAAESRAFPSTIPRKPRRGRRSEAAAVEDFVRGSLERTFASMREQNRDACIEKERVFKKRMSKEDGDSDLSSDDDDDDDWGEGEESKQTVVEEESSDWPLDADVGWGIRASEYFEKHSIRNVVADDGSEIDWEGEIDDSWVKEINCLEWESFAFHPSPMIVLVFERYQRATDNWKLLKELEKALKVYWEAKDRLPPRAVKLDINIERDLAYALKVRDCPQLLFLRGHKILYRDKGFRTADDLVHMIAFFYYNAKKPSWIDEELLTY